jgi:ABC-2 type transport system permease protein
MNKTWIIAKREFLSRVKKKTFLLSTILLPLLIFGFYALIIFFSISSDKYKLAVIDEANVFNGSIQSKNSELLFVLEDRHNLGAGRS